MMYGLLREKLPIDRRTDAYAVAGLLEKKESVATVEVIDELEKITRFGSGRSVLDRAEGAMIWLSYKFKQLYRVERTDAGTVVMLVRTYFQENLRIKENDIAEKYAAVERERKYGVS